jgi:predicted ATPase
LLPDGADVVGELLERAPRLICLATSRRPLGLAAEEEFLVVPLPTPAAPASPERLLQYASARLFVSRTQAARPEFQVTPANAAAVAKLCQALEGIPLALELAAARAPLLTPAQMLQHLSDRFGFLAGGRRDRAERHQTLRAALEWSYQSLPESRQRLLARLSVFRGGWMLDAAAAVCDGEAAPGAALIDALMELQDASLVIAEEMGEAMRSRMLETVREYGEERLAEWGEADVVRARHRDWYLELAERAEPDLERSSSALWLDRLENERENLRAALAWCRAEASGTEAGLRLAGALGRFWEARGYLSEGRSFLAEALGVRRPMGSRGRGPRPWSGRAFWPTVKRTISRPGRCLRRAWRSISS